MIRDCEPLADLAKEFRVSVSRISAIATEARRKPEVLRERISREAEKAERDVELADFVEEKLQDGEVIVRA